MNKMFKVGVSGTNSSGKTTLIFDLAASLKLNLIDTHILEPTMTTPWMPDDLDELLPQLHIIPNQIALEAGIQWRSYHDVLLVDRPVIDQAPYISKIVHTKANWSEAKKVAVVKAWKEMAMAWTTATYDALIFIDGKLPEFQVNKYRRPQDEATAGFVLKEIQHAMSALRDDGVRIWDIPASTPHHQRVSICVANITRLLENSGIKLKKGEKVNG